MPQKYRARLRSIRFCSLPNADRSAAEAFLVRRYMTGRERHHQIRFARPAIEKFDGCVCFAPLAGCSPSNVDRTDTGVINTISTIGLSHVTT